jgi:transglutaminase-like putative cysteine protease
MTHFLAVVALLLPLQASAASARVRAPDVLTVPRPTEPEWFGLYLLGQKAGWSKMEIKRERRGGAEVLVARGEVVLQATLAGNAVQRTQKEEKVYEAKPGGRLLSFRGEKAGDGGARKVTGTCTPRGCKVTVETPGAPTEVTEIPEVKETAEQADTARLVAALRSSMQGEQLSLDQLRVRRTRSAFVKRARMAGAGVETEVSVVAESEEEDRTAMMVSVTDDGRIAEIRFGESLLAKPEPEAVAKRLDKVDLFALSRVALPGPLPREVPATITFRLKGLPKEFYGKDERQSYVEAGNGETMLTVAARRPVAEDPAKDPPRPIATAPNAGEWYATTPEIDWDRQDIKTQAAQIVGDTRGVFAGAQKIQRWVFQNLKKAYGQSHDKASDVLRVRRGDCTEHARLFTALARAAGIPAREVHGLAYAEFADGVPALYWHAWAEVKAGNEWIAIDPTFGQPVADATHITLGRGTQVDTVGLMGALAVVSAQAVK